MQFLINSRLLGVVESESDLLIDCQVGIHTQEVSISNLVHNSKHSKRKEKIWGKKDYRSQEVYI